MHIRGFLLVAALGVAYSGAALGQQAAATTTTKASSGSGISLSFDAVHGQLTASGLAVKAKPLTLPLSSVTGTVNITVTINLVSTFHRDTRYPCAAILIGGEADTSIPFVDGGIETAGGNGTLDWKTKTVTCTFSIPYEWTLATDPSAGEGIFVGFAAAAVSREDVTQRSTIQIGGPLPLPASGTTTTLAFTTTL